MTAHDTLVELAERVGSALDDFIRLIVLNPETGKYEWSRPPLHAECQQAMEANNDLAAALGARAQAKDSK